jgi:hypothetical protein
VPSSSDLSSDGPEWVAHDAAPQLGATLRAPELSSVQAILAGSRLPTITELEEGLVAEARRTEGAAPSIAELLGPIDAAVARHAALIAEPLAPAPESAPPRTLDLTPAATEPTFEAVPEPTFDAVSEPTFDAVSEPTPVTPTPVTPTRRTTDRLLVDVPNGRDWDAEILRSAEMSPLIERGFGAAGISRREGDHGRDPSTDALAPWGRVVAPAPETPDSWWRSGGTRSPVRADSNSAPTDVLGPFGEVLLPTVDQVPLVAPATSDASLAGLDGDSVVSGEMVDIVQFSGLTFDHDLMVVPQRPMAEPMLARDPEYAQARTQGRGQAPGGSRRPRRRGMVRRLLRFVIVAVVLAAVIVGGYLAVEHFVLAKRWPVSLQPVSQFVQERTGLEFKRSIVVEEVPRAEFDVIVSEVRLGLPFDAAGTTVSDVMASSRALGLWSGKYDPSAAARVVGRAWPAVYDPVTRIVYVDADVTDSDRRKAYVSRELTLGLFDQVYRWSEQLAVATEGERLAYRTRMEAEALSIASAWLRELEGTPVPLDEMPPTMKFPDVDDESWGAVPDAQEVAVRVPLVSGAPLATGEVADLAAVSTSDGALLFSTVSGSDPPPLGPIADGDVLTAGLGPQGPQGASFWLTVLQTREDPSDAVAAMRGHRADDSRTVLFDADGDGTFDQVCVEARIQTAGRVGTNLLLASFERWAAMAPPQSRTTAVRKSPTIVAIRACDPGTAATTATRSTAAFDTVWLAAMRSVEMAPAAPTDEG